MITGGWSEDIHDPDNWVYAFLVGPWAETANLPEDLRTRFQDLASQGAAEMDLEARVAIYRQMSNLDYEYAVAIRTAVPTGRSYEQRWVRGSFFNPGYTGSAFYVRAEQ